MYTVTIDGLSAKEIDVACDSIDVNFWSGANFKTREIAREVAEKVKALFPGALVEVVF